MRRALRERGALDAQRAALSTATCRRRVCAPSPSGRPRHIPSPQLPAPRPTTPLTPLSPFSCCRRSAGTLAQFREGHFGVLVATDVAARGIDISGVDLIVQYRPPQVLAATATTFTTTSSSSPRSSPRSSLPPQDPDSYVHRSGRTGRAGKSGIAILLYGEREGGVVRALEQRAGVKFIRSGRRVWRK